MLSTNNSIKNLETVLESKKKVINTIISENKVTKVNESINLPISTMIKVAESELGKEMSTLSESEQKEVTSIINLSKDELKVEFNTIKETVISNLNNSLNESKEDDIKKMISQTIDKVNESNCTHYDLYKLKKLSLGL
jgi:F0F1-type ATP synthase membrane subunit b/b'